MKKILVIISITLILCLTGCIKVEERTSLEKTIDSFIKNNLESSINLGNGELDYNIVSGINLLNQGSYNVRVNILDYIDLEESKTYYEGLTYNDSSDDTINKAFKATVVSNVLGFDMTKLTNYFSDLNTYGSYSENQVVYALDILKVNSSLKTRTENALKNSYASWTDVDYAGLVMQSLKGNTPISFYNLIKTKVSVYGATTNDSYYEGVLYEGVYNSCSTSQAILGLLAYNKNIFYVEGHNLVNALISYYTIDGFLYTKDSEQSDSFSNSQGFVALCAAQVYSYTNSQVLLFK